MKMKFSSKITIATCALFMSLPAVQAADEEEKAFSYSANIALTSDYVFRGITQTDENPALQGGFDINHKSGFYVGTWASNVDFLEEAPDVAAKDRANLEIDIYAGYANEFKNGVNYNISVLHYLYPGAGDSLNYDYSEYHFDVGYSLPIGTGLNLAYDHSPDYSGKAGKLDHFKFAIDHDFKNSGFGIGAFVGKQSFDDNDAVGLDDYKYYGASISYTTASDFKFDLTYSDTDLDNAEDSADERTIFTISKSF